MTVDDHDQILYKIAGEMGQTARSIVKIMLEAENQLSLEAIEEKLAKDIDSKDIRQILYELNDRGYARSRRLRDNETGWITFLWNIFPDKILNS